MARRFYALILLRLEFNAIGSQILQDRRPFL